MRKRSRKIILAWICALAVLWCALFTVDYIRCSSLRAPLFVIPIDKIAKDGGSCTYLGLGYTVDLKKQADPEYGGSLRSVEMKLFGRVIAASIT